MPVGTKNYPKLTQDIETDICIIGGGITGAVTAYLLTKAGKRVVFLEKDTLISGATGKTTGFLTQAVDTDYGDLVKIFGVSGAKKVLESHGAAIDLAETIVETEDLDCNFKRSLIYEYAMNEKEMAALRSEYQTLLALGADVEIVPADLLLFQNVGALAIQNQAKFYGSHYARLVADKASKYGAEIYEMTAAKEILTDPLTVLAGGYKVHADWVISATYSPFNEPVGLAWKKAMYVSYVLKLSMPPGTLREGMYEDQHNPYHYFRVDKGAESDSIIVGGEDHRADIRMSPQKNFQALEAYTMQTFKKFSFRIESRWVGPILEPMDGLAFIGPYGHPNTLYAFAFSGSGMTYSHIAALMFRDKILGVKNPWEELYSPSRLPNATSIRIKGRDYIGELLNGAVKNSVSYRK